MQRRATEGKKKCFVSFSRVAVELAGGFGYVDEQNQLWCFGLQVADIAAKINTSNAVCLPEEEKNLLFQHNKCP